MELKLLRSLSEIPAAQWQTLCGPNFPFADYDHLLALEETHCVGAEPGWVPVYIALYDKTTLVGASYVYMKNNSYGEFIFDFAWAQAYARSGLKYFPKLVSAVPFTPATGEKILVHPQADVEVVRAQIIAATLQLMTDFKCSSVHFLYLPKERLAAFAAQGFLIRHSFQYHWKNRGYENFESFLAALTSKRRRQIQLERRQLNETGIQIETLNGDALMIEHARLMHELYLDTNQKMGSHACLTLRYFERIFDCMRDRIVLFVAKEGNNPVAAAINFIKGDAMYGRYWGCYKDVRNLHFELCYYRAVEYAIDKRLSRYEAGAQGEHKFPRGFLPELTYSAHAIAHPGFRKAIANFVEEEKAALDQMINDCSSHSPYRDAASNKV